MVELILDRRGLYFYTMTKSLRTITVILLLFIMISVGCFLLLKQCPDDYTSVIFDTVTEGKAYGYPIGEDKAHVFYRVQTLPMRKWLSARITEDEARHVYGANIYEPQHVRKLEQAFSDWNVWRIYEEPTDYTVTISFDRVDGCIC